jgi:hypothetical protein
VCFIPEYDNGYFLRDLSFKYILEPSNSSIFSEDFTDKFKYPLPKEEGTWVSLPYNQISDDMWFSLHEDKNYTH